MNEQPIGAYIDIPEFERVQELIAKHVEITSSLMNNMRELECARLALRLRLEEKPVSGN